MSDGDQAAAVLYQQSESSHKMEEAHMRLPMLTQTCNRPTHCALHIAAHCGPSASLVC